MKLGNSPRSQALTAKKCTRSVVHVQSCCFANLNHLLFDVLVAVAVVASLTPQCTFLWLPTGILITKLPVIKATNSLISG